MAEVRGRSKKGQPGDFLSMKRFFRMGSDEGKGLAVLFSRGRLLAHSRADLRAWIACRVGSILKMIHRRLFHFDDSKPIRGVNGLGREVC